MKKQSREALDAYYREAGSWAEDRNSMLRGSRRTAWIVASVAVAIAFFEALALLFLTPLKTVQPYTLLVDKQTGFVQALKPLDTAQVSSNTALTQSFLVQYVIARESFDIAAVQANYRKVALWSEGDARNAYVAATQASNPESPLARLPHASIIETRVKSISPLGGNSALIRFETLRRDAGGQPGSPQPWVAVIRYHYSGAPMSLEDRFLNPLGFEVTHYQRNAEALPPADPVPVPSPTPSASAVVAPGAPQSPPIVPSSRKP